MANQSYNKAHNINTAIVILSLSMFSHEKKIVTYAMIDVCCVPIYSCIILCLKIDANCKLRWLIRDYTLLLMVTPAPFHYWPVSTFGLFHLANGCRICTAEISNQDRPWRIVCELSASLILLLIILLSHVMLLY